MTAADWSPERVEELKSLCAERLSAGEISRALGNVSRNAVIGKLHRLGLKPHSGRCGMTPTKRQPLAPRPVAPLIVAPAPLMVPLVEIHASQCCFPMWGLDDGFALGFPCCGNPVEGERYCGYHRGVMYAGRPVASLEDRRKAKELERQSGMLRAVG